MCPGEEQLAEYACGSLPPAVRGDVELHVDRCATCRSSISAIAASLASVAAGEPAPAPADPAAIGAGTTIGRYVVLYPVGQGHGGDVFAAYDPELDRKLAIKVLRARAEATQLAVEARRLAKLAHPNVVTIHDVGQLGPRVFLAMELIEGETLRGWLATPRAWPEIRAVLGAAGRGLAAAHDAGLVHRDVKPENILLGADGRVRVCDFGFAHDDAGEWSGAVAGTPAYMAPEQLRGERPQTASDQFSFAVVAFEAICGARPFEADRRVMRAFAPRTAVPRAVREAIVRSLAEDPRARFPSLHALLARLDPPRSRRRAFLAGAGVAGVLGTAAAVAIAARGGETASPCERAGAASAWSPEVRGAVHARFLAAGPAAETTGPVFAARIDAYAGRLRTARVDACRATHERGEQSEAMLDVRMACLAQRHDELAALLDVYMGPLDATLVERAATAAAGLARIEDCDDIRAVLQAVPLPPEPAARAQIAAGRATLARVRVLRRTARYDEGLALATDQLARARATGYAPLLAEAQFELGWLQEERRLDAEAERSMRDAIQTASAARDDALVARAWSRLLRIGGVHRQQLAQVREWFEAGRAAVVRAGGSPALDGALEDTYAGVLLHRGDLAGAREHYTRARSALAQARDPALTSTLHNLGLTLVELGELDAGRAELERALASALELYGADHPEVATVLGSLGRTHAQVGDLDRAEELIARSVKIVERVHGPSHLDACSPLTNLANIALMRGHLEDARAHLERVLAIQRAQLGPEHLDLAATLSVLGSVELEAKQLAAARGYLERAIAIRAQVDARSPDLIAPLTNLGSTLGELGDAAAARATIERALAIAETLGPRHPHVAMTSSRLGKLAAKRGDRTVARAYLERALAVLRPLYGDDSIDVQELQRDLDALGATR